MKAFKHPLADIPHAQLERLFKDKPELREELVQSIEFLRKYELWKKENGIYLYQPIPKTVAFHKHEPQLAFCIRLLHGANRCLAGWQEIYDPVAKKNRRVDQIKEGFNVLAFDGEKLRTAKANTPFRKGLGLVYEVSFSSGTKLYCAGTHQVLTSFGYLPISQCQVGSSVFQPQSTSAFFQEAPLSSGLSYQNKAQDSQFGYHPLFRSCDEQFHVALDTDQGVFPLRACVLKRTFFSASQHMDGLENKLEYIPVESSIFRPSILDALLLIVGQSVLSLFQNVWRILKWFGVEAQDGLQSNHEFALQPRSIYEACLQAQELSKSHNSFAYITSIVPIGLAVKWDFEVPEYHNYWAGGVVNHNSSKTYTGAAEDVWYALGNHPYKKIETPNEGWVVSKDYNSQKEGVQNVIMKLLPKDRIKDVSHVKSEVIDTIWVIPEGEPLNTPKRDCSKITFKSCDSGVDKFGGAAKRWIHFDEEPPRDIYRECIARIGAGMPLDIWLTMTPIWEDKGKKIGMTWTYREIYQKRDGHRIFTLGVGIEDNIYLSKEQIEDQKKKYFGAEYDIRIKGEFKLLSGNQVFDPQAIERHDITCTEPLKRGRLEYGKNGRIQVVEDERGYLKIWEMPKNGEQYSIGADVGLGVGGDPSSTSVRTMSSLHQVATVNGQIAPDRMGEILIMLGTFYNKAWCGVEANSFGIATLDAMKHRYSKLYYRYKVDQRNDHKTKQIGWWTDTKTKPLMISDYGRAIREDALIFRDTETLDECMTYVIGEDGHANAELGCHDDRVIADMICLQVRKRFHMTSASVELESYVPANKTGGY